jgi:TonB family protein
MRTLYGILVACMLLMSGHAQGYNPEYGASITITYRAPKGIIPAEVRIAPPAYPFEMRRAGLSGEVSFEITVQDDGKVTDGMVTEASQPAFRQSVEEALATWRFQKRREEMNESRRPLLLKGKIRFSIVEE